MEAKEGKGFKRILKTNFLLIGLFLLFTIGSSLVINFSAKAANPPNIITYQGKVLVNGSAASTTLGMYFFLYDALTGGNLLYTASGTSATPLYVSTTPTNGLFSINLGDSTVPTNNLDPSLFKNNAGVYLEVQIGSQTLTPRKRVTTAPFALNAKYLDGVGATSTASTTTYIPISNSTGGFVFNTTTFNGNVGINTSSPMERLSIAGGNILHTASSSPTLKGSVDTSGTARSVYVSGQYAYVADDASGLQIIDISTPSLPVIVGVFNTSGLAYGVYVSGQYAYVGDDSSGLQIIDISNPTTPKLTGTYDTPGSAQGVYVSGKYAYVGDVTGGLKIIDISNSTAPSLVGTYTTSTDVVAAYVSGKYAYLSVADGGLEIVDVSNPTAPSLIGAYDTTTNVNSVYVSGRYAYVADGTGGFLIIDVKNPAAPSLLATLATNANARSVYVSGRYAYVADDANGLKVIDIASSTAPVLVGTYNTSGGANWVYVSGKYAYVADDTGGLNIIDINGLDTPAAHIGNIQTNDLTVTENVDIGNNLYIRNGANIGPGGLLMQGALAVSASSTNLNNTIFSIHASSTASILSVLIAKDNGNIGIGTASPADRLTISGGNLAITNGSATSTLGANFFSVASSTSAMYGVFYIDSAGNVSASGSLRTFGNVTSSGILYATNGIIAGNGSYGAPAYTFASATSGIYYSSADSLDIVASSTNIYASSTSIQGTTVGILHAAPGTNASIIAIGDGAPDTNVAYVDIGHSVTGTETNRAYLIRARNTFNLSSAPLNNNTLLELEQRTATGFAHDISMIGIGGDVTVNLNPANTAALATFYSGGVKVQAGNVTETYGIRTSITQTGGIINTSTVFRARSPITGPFAINDMTGLVIDNMSAVGVTTSRAIYIKNQTTAATTSQGILLEGTGKNNSIVWGNSALQYASTSENISFFDSSNLGGIGFNFTAAGAQTVSTTAGDLVFGPYSGNVRIFGNTNPGTTNLYDLGASSTQWRYGNFQGGIIIGNGSTSSTLSNTGLNLNQTAGFLGGNISFDSFGLISTSGSLRVSINASVSSTLQITATSTFFSDLVFDSTTLGRPLYGLVNSDVAGGSRGFWFATTTANTNGNNPLLVITATTTGDLDYARVGIGTSTYWGQTGLRDQLTVAGRIYSTWREFRCDHMTAGLTGLLTIVDTNLGCGGYMYDRISDSAFTPLTQYPPATRLEAGLTTSALTTEGAAVRMFDSFAPATTSPVFEAMIRLPSTSQTATQTVWAVGLRKADALGTAFDKDDEGVFFTVSSTGANWVTNVNDQSVGAAGKRQTNLGDAYASSTGSNLWHRMRIEVTSSTATFLIDGVVVAVHSQGIPSSNMSPYIGIGFLANTGQININHIDISYMRLWVDDPPGGFDSVVDSSATVAPSPPPPIDYANASNVGLWYPLRDGDESPSLGSLVAPFDNSLATSTITITLSTRAYQENIIGVVTANPHSTMGDDQRSAPVAVNGRVAVLVTDENGPIKSGDYLVASSKPGHAMKAIKAGQTIGQALTDFYGIGEGKLIMAVKPTYFSGVNLDDLLSGLKIISTASNFSKQMLTTLASGQGSHSATTTKSDLFTDRIAAGLEIITPKITVQSLHVADIAPTDQAVVFNLADGGSVRIDKVPAVGSTDATSTMVTFDSDGNLNLAGTLTVGHIFAEDIQSPVLDAFLDYLKNVSSTLDAVVSSTQSLATQVTGMENKTPVSLNDLLTQSSGLTFNGITFFNDGIKVDAISSIKDVLAFNSDTLFFGRPFFTADTGGFALIRRGQKSVDVVFEREYIEQPIVNITLALQQSDKITASSTPEEVQAMRAESNVLAENIFGSDIRYLVINQSVKGFTIFLNKEATADISFSWLAIAVNGAKTFSFIPVEMAPAAEPVVAIVSTTAEIVIPTTSTLSESLPSEITVEPNTTSTVPELLLPEASSTTVEAISSPSVPTTTESIIESSLQPAIAPEPSPTVQADAPADSPVDAAATAESVAPAQSVEPTPADAVPSAPVAEPAV
ncbi:MAG: hypothetical protein Q7S66_00365 [bacterium]|nr:hypothetical protein [bacterium]